MRGLLPWLAILHTASCGHFLFWLPMSSKSVKIALVDMGYALAKKGHQITIVCPDKAKKQIPGVTEINNESDLDVLQNAISEKQLVEKAEIPVFEFVEVRLMLAVLVTSFPG